MHPPQAPETDLVRLELHTHSTASDGEFKPAMLAQEIHAHGVEVWALTDHDTCDGCVEARSCADELGVTFISGIEMTAQETRSIHVLGYGVDVHDATLQAFLAHRREARTTRMQTMVGRAVRAGYGVTMEQVLELAAGANLTRPHLAQALVEAGAAQDIPDAFDRLLSEDGALHAPHAPMLVAQCARVMRDAGGVIVLAHPGRYGMDDHVERWIKEADLDGIEVGHPTHTSAQQALYTTHCEAHGILATTSSDFHGPRVRPERGLGDVEAPRAWVEAFVARVRAR